MNFAVPIKTRKKLIEIAMERQRCQRLTARLAVNHPSVYVGHEDNDDDGAVLLILPVTAAVVVGIGRRCQSRVPTKDNSRYCHP